MGINTPQQRLTTQMQSVKTRPEAPVANAPADLHVSEQNDVLHDLQLPGRTGSEQRRSRSAPRQIRLKRAGRGPAQESALTDGNRSPDRSSCCRLRCCRLCLSGQSGQRHRHLGDRHSHGRAGRRSGVPRREGYGSAQADGRRARTRTAQRIGHGHRPARPGPWRHCPPGSRLRRASRRTPCGDGQLTRAGSVAHRRVPEPVEKSTATLTDGDAPLGDCHNMVYMGTSVTYGRGTAVVVETGMTTQLGRIAQLFRIAIRN